MLAGVGALWGSVDGVIRNYHSGLGGLRAALNLGSTAFAILCAFHRLRQPSGG